MERHRLVYVAAGGEPLAKVTVMKEHGLHLSLREILWVKARIPFVFLSPGLTAMAETPAVTTSTESKKPPSTSDARHRIQELIQQDAAKTPSRPRKGPAPFLNPDAPGSDQPVAEGVVDLDPLQVTKKKPIELSLRIKPVTLDNFSTAMVPSLKPETVIS